MSEEMSALLSDADMKYIPWVSAAAPLGVDKVAASSPTGHVFCFLPLPLQRYDFSLTSSVVCGLSLVDHGM